MDIHGLDQCLIWLFVGVYDQYNFPTAFLTLIQDMTRIGREYATVSAFVKDLKRLIDLLTPEESVQTQPISRDDIVTKLQDVQMSVEDSEDEFYIELFTDLEAVCYRVLDSSDSTDARIGIQDYEEVFQVLDAIQEAIEQQQSRSTSPILRLSSSCASDQSLDFFAKQMQRLVKLLGIRRT